MFERRKSLQGNLNGDWLQSEKLKLLKKMNFLSDTVWKRE